MISAEVAQNPVLEEATEGGEELTPEELQPLLEAEGERSGDPADQSILEVTAGPTEMEGIDAEFEPMAMAVNWLRAMLASAGRHDAGLGSGSRRGRLKSRKPRPPTHSTKSILARYFDDYLDPGYKSPASEISEKPSFETFLSSPVTLQRSSALATGADRAARSGARRGRRDHRKPGRKRLPDFDVRGDCDRRGPRSRSDGGGAARGPHAGPGRGGLARICASACCCRSKAATARAAWPGRSLPII